MNSSNSLRFISFFVPTKRTKGQFGARRSASKRLIPILLYAAASSFVIVSFSQIGIVSTFFIISHSFHNIDKPASGSFPALQFRPRISRPPLCGVSAVGTQTAYYPRLLYNFRGGVFGFQGTTGFFLVHKYKKATFLTYSVPQKKVEHTTYSVFGLTNRIYCAILIL